jgi:hypothetical protein
LLIIVLLLIVLAAILYALSQVGKGGQGGFFDAASYALQIARGAYRVRQHHAPTGHDFGGSIIVVQYADGSRPLVLPSPIYEGYDSPPPDVNATHSERRTQDDFILPMLLSLRRRGIVAKASEIDVILFTQFYPCPPCRAEMRAWQKQDRQAAGTENVFMTVWTLAKSFSPLSRNPRQRAQPVITGASDLVQVSIPFDALSPSRPPARGLTLEREFSYNGVDIVPRGERTAV